MDDSDSDSIDWEDEGDSNNNCDLADGSKTKENNKGKGRKRPLEKIEASDDDSIDWEDSGKEDGGNIEESTDTMKNLISARSRAVASWAGRRARDRVQRKGPRRARSLVSFAVSHHDSPEVARPAGARMMGEHLVFSMKIKSFMRTRRLCRCWS